ncbi:enoyl-CoA hydratase/isomerase family protein [Gulosibacter molinativorax]|uniref:Enoyl-CoA hydratase/isomerase family protein n=1 Tax=Gulosibacter molinativorax TaxID=256821 RepID=A0ABT7CBA9_9MICO|nr:enoyl-CoA hydratase/isomerase family protein [Gulosibacter molinativorax]MDJ1372485.1 enoyl-CoA hydratase/isomerase family protein [Gulosibacter molinativorax]QUY61938.1 Hypotetical protein [Gulosibacter molinativorax]
MQVDIEIADSIATITLNEPATRNALHDEALVEIHEHLDSAAAAEDVTTVVIRGASRAFTSGGSMTSLLELAELRRGPDGAEIVAQRTRQNSSLVERILAQPQLTVALISGPVAGAGLGIAGACDLRFAVPEAKFVPGFGSLGLTTDLGALAMVRRAIGDAAANSWFISGEIWSADVARERGYLDGVLTEADALARITKLSGRLTPDDRHRIARQRSLSFAAAALAAELDREADAFTESIDAEFAQLRIRAAQR